MNRRLLVVVTIAAVGALLAGAAVGRNLLSSATPTAAKQPSVVEFRDRVSKFAIDYPGSWHHVPANPADPDLVLLATAPNDATTLLLVRVSASGLDQVTARGLPVVRRFTDGLLAANPGVKLLVPPNAVSLGGLPGWRYRYTYTSGSTRTAHDHYFLFKDGRLIQLVFQAIPATRLPALEPAFQKIAGTFRGRIS